MGYTKIVRFGDTIELYEYEKNISSNRRHKHISSIQRKRRVERIASKAYVRSDFSIKRAKRNFFRLCHHNNLIADTVTFITLTYADDPVYSDCSRDISLFFKRLKKQYEVVGHKEVSYIGVPELTKKGRYHFHLLVYNLPPELAKGEVFIGDSSPRASRNIQRCWRKGYVTADLATYTSEGIAGYMAKYMGKSLGDPKSEARRGYNCSRNIEKISNVGSNSFDRHAYIEFDALTGLAINISDYKVPFLGTCTYTKYRL